jgi:SAM-dependent methyltransferase
MKHVNCNLCGSSRHTLRFSVGQYRLVCCSDCGLNFFNPQLDDEDLLQLYRNDYFLNDSLLFREGPIYGYQDYLGDRFGIQQDFQSKVMEIGRYVQNGQVLDIGCAYGFFLELMKKQGWETHGVELNHQAVKFAKDELGLNVREGIFEEMEFSRAEYDLVTMFDVVEHLIDPRAALVKVNEILKPDGLLVISTVDINSLVARLLGPKWEDIRRAKTHLWLFSNETMPKMLDLAGFEVINTTSYGKLFELGYALKRATPYSPILMVALRRLSSMLNLDRKQVHINVRSKLCYYCRRKRVQ